MINKFVFLCNLYSVINIKSKIIFINNITNNIVSISICQLINNIETIPKILNIQYNKNAITKNTTDSRNDAIRDIIIKPTNFDDNIFNS